MSWFLVTGLSTGYENLQVTFGIAHDASVLRVSLVHVVQLVLGVVPESDLSQS